MNLVKIDYFDDELFDDEFQVNLDPTQDIMLTNAGNWTPEQIETYKENKRKENQIHLIKYIRQIRHEQKQKEADKKKMKMSFVIAVVSAVGTGLGGLIWLLISS